MGNQAEVERAFKAMGLGDELSAGDAGAQDGAETRADLVLLVVGIAVVLVVRLVVWSACLDDVECKAVLQLHAGRSQDSAKGTRGASLLADDFANVARCNVNPQDGRFLIVEDLDFDRVSVVDEGAGDLGHKD
jgi:hypothetical protein